ncbi:MAG: FtsX-like permease family protein [Methanobrevibacter sp.]|jgi:putative ABC transport system permease protein|nr:FtsX-like permease family protein [Candidatus Methanovirga australis]
MPSSDITIPDRVDAFDKGGPTTKPQNITEDLIDKIKSDNRVEKVVGTYRVYCNINETKSLGLVGFDSSNANFMKIDLSAGRIFNDNEKEIVLSNYDAKSLNKTLGDDMDLHENTYKIVGIAKEDNKISYSSITSIKNVKELSLLENLSRIKKYGPDNSVDESNGKLEYIYIKVKKGVNASQVTKDLKSELGNGNLTIEGPDEKEVAKNKYLYDLNRIISELIPVLMGIILTLLCITKSVYDRTREIGVLKAIGWKSKRIFLMIISETIILTIASYIIASTLVILITFNMNNIDPYSALDFPTFLTTLPIKAFLKTFCIVLIMALIGAIFPAIKASKLSPAEAVREE